MVLVNKRAAGVVYRALEGVGGDLTVRQDEMLSRGQTVTVGHNDAHGRLVPLWAGPGYPQDVTRALSDIAELKPRPEETFVVVFRALSPGGEALLAESKLSWADETGRARITTPTGLVLIRDRPAQAASTARKPNWAHEMAWYPGSAAVAEQLLVRACGRDWSDPDTFMVLPFGADLADSLGVAPGLVSRALIAFDELGWTVKSGASRGSTAVRHLVDPAGMLSSWAQWHSRLERPEVLAHATYRDPAEFVRDRLAAAWPPGAWAMTSWLALEQQTPWVTSLPHLTLYIAPDAASGPSLPEDWLRTAGLRPVDGGARVHIIIDDRFVMHAADETGPIPVVSDIRLYGDLLREGPRGVEAADHLRTTQIGF